jgi:hypothetical protein
MACIKEKKVENFNFNLSTIKESLKNNGIGGEKEL